MSYSSEVLADSPIGYWRLDGSNRLADASGNSHTLSATGTNFTDRASLLNSDPANGSCEFDTDTADGYLALTDSTAVKFTGTTAFTVECWFDPVVADAAYRRLFSWSDESDASTNCYFVLYQSTYGISFQRRVAGTDTGTFYLPTTLDSIHHVVGVYTGSVVRTYVDGSANVSSDDSSGSQGSYAGTFRIGKGQYDAAAAKAIIDEVAIYSGVLSTTRIDAHYQAGIQGGSVAPIAVLSGVGW